MSREHPNIGEQQKNIIVVGVKLPGGTGSCCWCTAWVLAYVTSLVRKSCLGIACIFPGPTLQRPVNRFGGNGVDLPAGNWLFQPRVGCVPRNTPVVDLAKVNSSFNVTKFSCNCSLFVQLPSPETRRPQLGRETQLLERILTPPD